MLKYTKGLLNKIIGLIEEKPIDTLKFTIICNFKTYLKILTFIDSLGTTIGIWEQVDIFKATTGQTFKFIIDDDIKEEYLVTKME